jgi:hypothetical protein
MVQLGRASQLFKKSPVRVVNCELVFQLSFSKHVFRSGCAGLVGGKEQYFRVHVHPQYLMHTSVMGDGSPEASPIWELV